MKHVVLVDSTVSGLLAFEAAKKLGHYVTYIQQRDSSFLEMAVGGNYEKFKKSFSFVDEKYEVETLHGPEFHELLVRLNRERKIDAIISTSEAAIEAIAIEAEHFNLIYPSHESLCKAIYKDKLRQSLEQSNVRSPQYVRITEDELIEGKPINITPPFVVKPTRGFGKQFSKICLNQQDFDEFISEIKSVRINANHIIDKLVSSEYIIEEYISGSLHSAEVVVQNGKLDFYATTVRFRSTYSEMLEMTATMPSGFSRDEISKMKDYVTQVFSELDLQTGLYHVELLKEKNGFCLVEINARMMGSVAPQMYKMMTGIDPYELLIKIHLGEQFSIDDTVLKNAGTVVTIASKFEGKISKEYDQEKFKLLLDKYDIDFCTAWVQPEQPVNKYTGNIGTIGHVIVLGEDPYEVARKGNNFLYELDDIYGLEMARYF